MTVGDRIKKQREFLGISQTELAKIVKTNKQTIYKYENNIITNIPSDKIELIAEALSVTPGYLMGWDDNLTEENSDFVVELLSNKELLDNLKKLMSLSNEHRQTIFDNITYWYEKEGH